jgi:hypothetical protein
MRRSRQGPRTLAGQTPRKQAVPLAKKPYHCHGRFEQPSTACSLRPTSCRPLRLLLSRVLLHPFPDGEVLNHYRYHFRTPPILQGKECFQGLGYGPDGFITSPKLK